MPDPGLAPEPQLPSGERELQRAQQAGFTGPELNAWKQQQSDRMRQAGFQPGEIDHYWGDDPPKSNTIADMARAAASGELHSVAQTVDAITQRAKQAQAQMGQGVREIFSAGQPAPGNTSQAPWDLPINLAKGALDYSTGAWSFITAAPAGVIDTGPGKLVSQVPLPGGSLPPTFLGDAASTIAGAIVGARGAEPAPVGIAARAATIQAVTRGELKDPGHMPAAVVGEPNVTPQMRDAVPSAQDYASAASSVVGPAKIASTTGQGVFFHGARGEIGQLHEGYYNPNNIYGGYDTLYTTDSRAVASGYERGRSTGTTYQVTERAPVKMFDMEGARTEAEWEQFLKLPPADEAVGVHDEALGEAIETVAHEHGGKANLRQIMDEVRGVSRGYGLSKDEVQEGIFDPIIETLKAEGFGGMSHQGGLRTGASPHQVKIYFNPSEQLDIERAGPPGLEDQTETIGRVTSNMHRVWVETGLSPAEQLDRAKTDPAFRQELLAQDVNGDPVTPHFAQAAKPEPKPLAPANTEPPTPFKEPVAGEEAPPRGPVFAPTVDSAMGLLEHLEGSGDLAVSPAGAVGRFQIMPATARMYDPNLRNLDYATITQRLKDPAYNERLARMVVGDLYRKYHGNMDAIAIAYNAGPKRANEYLTAGPGTRLEAVLDKTVRGGVRYFATAAEKDESFLPLETQKYLANARRRVGGPLSAEEGAGGEIRVPSYDPNARPESVEEEPEPEGEKLTSGSLGAASIWDDAPIEDAQREVLSNIGEQPSMDWSKDLSPDAMADKLFAINPARRLDTALSNAKLLDRDTEFGIEDAFRQTFASDNRANVFVRHGQIDGPEGKNIIPGSNSLWDAVKALKEDGGNPDGFRAWLMSKRTVDKAAQEIDTGVNPMAAARIAEDIEENKKYKRAGQIWTSVLNSTLDYAEKSGRYSADQVAAMKASNPTYVSFRRIMGDEDSFKAKSGYGFTLGNPLKRMEGSDKQIIDPLVASIDNMRLVIASADQNWARGKLIELAEGNKDIAKALGLKKAKGARGLSDDAIEEILAPYREQMSEEELKTAIEGLGSTAEASLDRSLGDNEFAYYRNGKREVWSVQSPEFAQMLRGSTDRAQVGLITRVFQIIAAGARSGIVIMPDFPLRNAVSHQVIQFINDPSHPPPFMAPIKGLMDVVGASDIYQDAMAKGAMGAAITDLDRDYLAVDMAKLFGETGVSDKVWNTVKAPFEAARWIQERSDAINRVGLYKLGIENGLDPQKAAMRSRTAGIDYAEKLTTAQLKWWARTTPFFKARLLYLNQAAQAWKEHPGMTAAFAVGAVSLPATTLWAINQWQDQFLPEDRKFANIPRWEKDYALITPEINGVRLKVRYPEGTGWLFGAMVTRALDAMAAHNPAAMDDWWKGLLQQLPLEAPPAIQTPLENATNYNVFTGNPMIPGSLTQASTDMKYTENTTPVARQLSKLISPITDGTPLKTQFSPIAIDHLVAGWTGTAGLQALKLVGAPFSRPGPPTDLADLPVIKGFVIRNPGFNAQAIEDYYTEKAKFDAALADVQAERRNLRAGDTADLPKVQREVAMARADYKLNQASHALGIIRSEIYGIYADKTMSDDEKRQHIEAIYVQEIQIAKSWTAQMREMEAR